MAISEGLMRLSAVESAVKRKKKREERIKRIKLFFGAGVPPAAKKKRIA